MLRLLLAISLWAVGAPAALASPTAVVINAPADRWRERAQIAKVAQTTLARIAADQPTLAPPATLELRLVVDASDLAAAAPPGWRVPEWASGVSFSGTNIVAVALTRNGAALPYLDTVAHEVAHAALDSALRERAPRWLHEGFAALYSTSDNWAHMTTLAGIAWFDNATPLHQLDATFRAHHVTAGRAYAQSYDFVTYLAERGRYEDQDDDGDPWPFRRFVAALAAGKTGDEAAVANFGAPLSTLFEQWQASLSTRYFLLPVALLSSLFWVLVCLLLVLAWWRKRRHAARVLATWAAQERADDALLGSVEERDPQVVEQPLQ
ncbi:MAG: hypothetical protein IPL79_06905 [Myxococcales bacterium]|nr:hypothetical protein [Myxococcales bacterium]